MTEQERDLMGRYIYEVIRHLPKNQRNEIRMELEELIGDMLSTEGATMEALLTELGDPALFAKKYRNEKSYVIGPDYYDNYIWLLRIVVICVAASGILSAVMETVTGNTVLLGGTDHVSADGIVNLIVSGIINLFSTFIVSGTAAVGSVTLVFWFLEYQQIKFQMKEEKAWTVDHLNAMPDKDRWTPKLLAPVPDRRALISRGESLAEVILLVVFGVLFIMKPNLLGAYVFDEGSFVSIPLFNLEQWNVIAPVFLIPLIFGFIDAVIRLITGYYCKLVMVSSIISGTVQIVFAFILLKLLPFFNPDFITEISDYYNKDQAHNLLSLWGSESFTSIVFGIICFVTLLEAVTAIYKNLRYGVKKF